MSPAADAPAADGGLRWGQNGLVPVVIQDVASSEVLMVAYMNREALAATRATGRTHFWSRSRGKLWRKGETSGHEQEVEDIYVNCEANSLLVKVRQTGAVCHDGYPTCFYRRLEPDGTLVAVRERAFDPAAVYAAKANGITSQGAGNPSAPPEHSTRILYGALAYLRDNDLSAVSRTSALLRGEAEDLPQRVADEMDELSGVLDGTHRHNGQREDVLLEGTQVIYWLLLSALRAGVAWDQLRPDRALATVEETVDRTTVARLLRSEARLWRVPTPGDEDNGARCHAALALVAQACRVVGLTGHDLIAADLAEMRTRPYLAPFFASLDEVSDAAYRP